MTPGVYRAALVVLSLWSCGCAQRQRDATASAPHGERTPSSTPAWPDSELRAFALPDPAFAIAESLNAAGASVAALAAAQRERAAIERRHGSDSPEASAAMTVVARYVHAQGDFEAASRLDAAALAVRRRVFGERHPLVAQSLLQLAGDVKNAGGPWTVALQMARQSLLLRRELLPEGAPEIGESLMGVGNMHRVMNRPDSARAAFREALALRRGLVPPNPDAVAASLTALSLVATQSSDWSTAEPLLREAVEIRRGLGTTSRGGLEMSLSTYGMTLRHLGHSAHAESILTECAVLRESLRRSAARGRGRAAMFDLSIYWQLAAAQLDRDRGEAAWVSVERGLSRTLIESLHDCGAIDTLGMWRDALGRVQRALAPDAAIIGWLELKRGAGREGYPMWCYAIRDHGPVRWHRVDGPRGDMWHGSSDVLYGYKSELHAAAGWPLRLTDTTDVARLGRAIYSLRIAPLAGDLVGVRRLQVVSPDVMRGVPLEALTDTTGRWLGDRFEISYTPSALLGAMQHGPGAPRRAPSQWRALLVGDPAYAGHAVASATVSPGAIAVQAAESAPQPWARLAASRTEIAAIGAMLPRATLLLGTAASEGRLRALSTSGALKHFDLIHFATHAEIDERRPGRSALVLSESAGPVAHREPGAAVLAGSGESAQRDGLVTVDEIAANWRLDARLVSLAACKSVLGPVSHVEGYIGFEQALLGAGARSLLVSLWHVDDEPTALLMRRFYGNLLSGRMAPPATAAAALREAQYWLRTLPGLAGGHPYAHPVYWAGIVLIGDPD